MRRMIKQRALELLVVSTSLVLSACSSSVISTPSVIAIDGIAQNPEGIEYDKNDNTFLLSSLNAMPIIKVNFDGSYQAFTKGEKFPLSTAGLQIDYKHNRLLVAGFNGMEIMDKDEKTKGVSFLRVYNLKTGVLEKEINLSSLVPNAKAYFANDIAVDNQGNAYISDWYAKVIYKVDMNGEATLFWKNSLAITGGPNGLDVHPDGYLLVSLLSVNDKGLYANYGLAKIPLNNPKSTTVVDISDARFSGFDGMVITPKGKVVGVTNNQKRAGGNTLMELSSSDSWKSAKVVHAKEITPSTTVALTADGKNYIINQDFSDNLSKSWKIEQVGFF
jgi:sugar lactone lactonase YvrE